MSLTSLINYGDGGFSKETIEVCLQTVQFSDEIIVVDFSSDGIELRLVKKYRLKVVKAPAENDFSFWRNMGADKATGEWLLYVDPDERISPALAEEIKHMIVDSKFSAYRLARENYYLGKRFKHAGAWPDRVLRLIRKNSLIKWEGILHEQPRIKGKVGQLKEPIVHLTHRSIEQMALKTINWSKMEAKLRVDAGHPRMTAWRFWRIMLTSFWHNFVKNKACFDGTEGVVEGMFQMFSSFFTYVRLWEIQQKPTLAEKYRQIDKGIIQQWQEKK